MTENYRNDFHERLFMYGTVDLIELFQIHVAMKGKEGRRALIEEESED